MFYVIDYIFYYVAFFLGEKINESGMALNGLFRGDAQIFVAFTDLFYIIFWCLFPFIVYKLFKFLIKQAIRIFSKKLFRKVQK